jgi:hypothetical protein
MQMDREQLMEDEACVRLFKATVLRWMQTTAKGQGVLHVHTLDLSVRNRKYTIDRWLHRNHLRVSYVYDGFQCIYGAYVAK